MAQPTSFNLQHNKVSQFNELNYFSNKSTDSYGYKINRFIFLYRLFYFSLKKKLSKKYRVMVASKYYSEYMYKLFGNGVRLGDKKNKYIKKLDHNYIGFYNFSKKKNYLKNFLKKKIDMESIGHLWSGAGRFSRYINIPVLSEGYRVLRLIQSGFNFFCFYFIQRSVRNRFRKIYKKRRKWRFVKAS
jgi:hypothetical protein